MREYDGCGLVAEAVAEAVLTKLFPQVQTDETPAIVERIATDIDDIVRLVRFCTHYPPHRT